MLLSGSLMLWPTWPAACSNRHHGPKQGLKELGVSTRAGGGGSLVEGRGLEMPLGLRTGLYALPCAMHVPSSHRHISRCASGRVLSLGAESARLMCTCPRFNVYTLRDSCGLSPTVSAWDTHTIGCLSVHTLIVPQRL